MQLPFGRYDKTQSPYTASALAIFFRMRFELLAIIGVHAQTIPEKNMSPEHPGSRSTKLFDSSSCWHITALRTRPHGVKATSPALHVRGFAWVPTSAGSAYRPVTALRTQARGHLAVQVPRCRTSGSGTSPSVLFNRRARAPPRRPPRRRSGATARLMPGTAG